MTSPSTLAPASRDTMLDQLEGAAFDLLVIGGGITGAGIARDAALRGLSVAVLEANDFASGTSSRSSKLIHGGLRYLALGDVGLVRETALERKRVYRLAPHLAEPLWMLAPARSRAGLLKFRAAITMYEKLGAVASKDRHQNWEGETLRENEPGLNTETYPYACAYREYLTDDARLVLANLREATRNGAVCANHLRVTSFTHESGKLTGVEATCQLSDRKVPVKATATINAAGPWVEELMSMDEGTSSARLHLSKGVHIVVDRARLPVRNLVIMGTDDKRTIFAITRGESVYVGTTDTTYPHDATVWPEINAEDVDYLLRPLAETFNVAPIDRGDVIAAWSGLRPLVAQAGKQAKEISRRDEIWIGASGLLTIAGGKLTGYRKMAIDVVERVLQEHPSLRKRAKKVDDVDEQPLPGGDFAGDLSSLAKSLAQDTGMTSDTADRLVRLYGAEATAVAALGSAPVVEGGTIIGGEINWSIEQEAAATLEDVIYRRTRAALYCGREVRELLEPVAQQMQAQLGWSDAHHLSQLEHVRGRLRHDLAFADNDRKSDTNQALT